MPLEVYLEDTTAGREQCICRDCGHKHDGKGHKVLYSTVIAHSYAAMASHCGLFFCIWKPEHLDIKLAGHLIPHLELGLCNLKMNPDYYRHYVLRDHYFNYVADMITFAQDLLAACNEFPNATVRVDT